jgi:hypothetical protein
LRDEHGPDRTPLFGRLDQRGKDDLILAAGDTKRLHDKGAALRVEADRDRGLVDFETAAVVFGIADFALVQDRTQIAGNQLAIDADLRAQQRRDRRIRKKVAVAVARGVKQIVWNNAIGDNIDCADAVHDRADRRVQFPRPRAVT